MNAIYKHHVAVVYPVMGFGKAVEPAAEFGNAATAFAAALETWAKNFLSDDKKFVNGDSLSIVEYKIMPFIFAAQCCEEKVAGFKVPARMVKYLEDALEAMPKMKEMLTVGDSSCKTYIASKEAIPTA
jgi:hypothetical protein